MGVRSSFHLLGAALLLMGAANPQFIPVGPAPTVALSPAEKVSVGLAAFCTQSGSATFNCGNANTFYPPGGSVFVLAGSIKSGKPVHPTYLGPVGCREPKKEQINNSVHYWKAKVKVREATMEGLTLEVDWFRETAAGPKNRTRAAGDLRIIRMKEGETHTLDFVTEPEDDGLTRSLRIDLSAEIVEDPRFSGSEIHYELWLVDEAPGGQIQTQKLQLSGKQGKKLDFSFPPLRWIIPGAKFHDGKGCEALAVVSGFLRGRWREDGSVAVLLNAQRGVGLAPSGENSDGSSFDGGEKSLLIREGETLSLVLPEAEGTHILGVDGTWSTVFGSRQMTSLGQSGTTNPNGIDLNEERILVDFGSFLRGHKMTLRLIARHDPS